MAPQPSNSGAIPASLPPSVEEAYRRKCVQLKNRTNEVEEANDAARLRLARTRRQVEKLRMERAFLLEQLAKRTSANVEDSDGSPSPPPMEHNIDFPIEPEATLRKPKEKPLRIKRHRKSAAPGDPESKDTPPASFTNRPPTPSPAPSDRQGDTNGTSKTPRDAFDVYCSKERPILEAKNKDSDANVDEELERGWRELPEVDKDEYQARYEQDVKDRESKQVFLSKERSEGDKGEPRDEDVTMANYDTEDNEPQVDKDGED